MFCFSCRFRFRSCAKLSPQRLQLKGLFPACMRSWSRMLPSLRNSALQTGQRRTWFRRPVSLLRRLNFRAAIWPSLSPMRHYCGFYSSGLFSRGWCCSMAWGFLWFTSRFAYCISPWASTFVGSNHGCGNLYFPFSSKKSIGPFYWLVSAFDLRDSEKRNVGL